jgi:hypothetical protein
MSGTGFPHDATSSRDFATPEGARPRKEEYRWEKGPGMVYIVVGPGTNLCRSQESTPNRPRVGESDMKKTSDVKKADVALIVLLILVLSLAVVIVDHRWLRLAIAFVPTLLLAYQGLRAADRSGRESTSGEADRRKDLEMRAYVEELLRHIREFYLTCHMMGTGRMSPDDAVEKAAQQELELNRLLARVTDRAKAMATR